MTSAYSDISFWQRVHLATVLVRLPFVIIWINVRNYIEHRETSRRRTATRVIRWVSEKCSYQQIAFFMPSSVDVYKTWMGNKRLEIAVEELAEQTKLMWVGGKRTDRVVLYFPGGTFLFALNDSAISFWHHVRNELEIEDSSVGLAILGYSPLPAVSFPIQIRQAMLAVEHIVASGVHPSNLQIVGDTTGAHLILALLSHIMHPLDGIRRIVLPIGDGRIRGVYLMSPWVALESAGPSSRRSRTSRSCGLVSTKMRKAYTALFMAHHDFAPDDIESLGQLLPYVDPSRAPGWWFSSLDGVVDRLFMSAGGEEPMRDDIIAFSQVLGRVKAHDFVFEVQEGGVCCDPYLDFVGGGGGGGGGEARRFCDGSGRGRGQGRLGLSIVKWLEW